MTKSLHMVVIPRLEAALRASLEGEVRFDKGARAAYAADASNYRQVPLGVVLPKSVEDVVAAVAECRRAGAPLLVRGGGTSRTYREKSASMPAPRRCTRRTRRTTGRCRSAW